MPKDEVDPDDPMELHGVEIPAADDRAMALMVVDEYVRLGFARDELLGLFTDPRYAMTHRIFRRHGEEFVRACVDHVLDCWTNRDC